MKTSNYNYYLPLKDGRTLIFNGLTERYFTVSGKNCEAIRGIIENPSEEAYDRYKTFMMRLLNEGFILNDEKDEYELVIKKYENLRSPEMYYLLLFPTFACNLRCWYCTQHHLDINMDDGLLEKLKRHIPEYLKANSEIKHLYISWFGGEPMLGFNRIEELNTFAKEYCDKHGISFSSGMTTNSTLMTPEKIKRLRELCVWHYQITIDGDEKSHNETKHLKGKNTYKTALENIRLIVELIPEAQCVLRINYSGKNLNADRIIDGIIKEIPAHIRGRITFLPRKIWQVNPNDIDSDEVEKLVCGARKSGFLIGDSGLGMCYVNMKHYTCILPDGGIIKCDNSEITDSKGYINDSGKIVRTGLFNFESIPPIYKDSVCSKCKHFPICFGPCPASIDSMVKEYGDIRCKLNDPDRKVEEHIHRFSGMI